MQNITEGARVRLLQDEGHFEVLTDPVATAERTPQDT